MKRVPFFVTALFLAAALAGCVGSDDTVETDDGLQDDAEDARVTGTTGSIQGTVASDLFEPLAGASITLVETARETKVARNGEFTLNDIEPGRYTLHVTAVAYLPYTRSVEVMAGEVTQVKAQLTPTSSQDPYVESRYIVDGIGTGLAWQVEVPGQGCVVGPSESGWDKTCGGIGGRTKELNITPSVETILVELVWEPAGPLGENLQLDIICESAPRSGSGAILDTSHPCYYQAPGTNSPLIVRADKQDSVDAIAEGHEYKWQGDWALRVFTGHGVLGTYDLVGSDVGLLYEQKFEYFVSISHLGPLPEDYSGVPDR